MSLPRSITVGGKEIPVPVTLGDRFAYWRNPEAGLARWQARARLAIAGGYSGADRTRRANQLGWRREMDAATAILPDLGTLREESQDLARNNGIASGALALNVTKVVGRGLVPKAQIDRQLLGLSDEQADAWERQAEREFHLAADTVEIDAERKLPFGLLQGLAFLRTLEDGDILVNLPRITRPGSPYRLKLELIEAARLSNPDWLPDTDRRAGGVTTDEHGAPVTYHVCNRHPGNRRRTGDGSASFSWSALKAFDSAGRPLCLHLYDKRRPGQPRGVPYLAPVIELIKQLGRYTDAEVMAAVVNGMFSVFIESDIAGAQVGWSPAPNIGNPDGDAALQTDPTGLELGYGSVVELPAGMRANTAAPGRPNQAFDGFVLAVLRQIGMALELPYEVLIRHFSTSYSASRAALEEAWDYFLRRRHWLAVSLCQPVYEAILGEAIARGRLQAPGFGADPLITRAWLGSLWIGEAPSALDPVKEIEAAERRVALRLTSRSEERSRLVGGDWEACLPQIAREEQAIRTHGLQPVEPKAPAAMNEPESEEDDDAID